MKLRDRTKRVLPNNIKQEDHKPVLTLGETSTFMAIDTDTSDIAIKKEDAKEHKDLSEQEGDLDQKEYRYQCDLCKMKMANLISVLNHRTSIHGIKQIKNSRIENMDVEPDVHEPNFYCKTCGSRYSNARSYRQHLRHVHYMFLKPMPKWSTPESVTAPDPNDPSFLCRACNRTYKSKNYYKEHCRFTHGLNTASSKRTRTSSTMTDSYCQVCDMRLSSIDSYRRHLFVIHKVDTRPIQQKQNDIIPNVNDPNFYCRSCEKRLASKESLRNHLKQVHSIFQSAPRKKSSLIPNADDPNNYCRACQKTFLFKGQYRAHLRLTHQMKLSPLRGNASREQLPDPYNPDYYCSVCKNSYASLELYRRHCKRFHLMTLNHASILNPTADINVNDPKGYCAQCERSFSSKIVFKRHLARVHSI